MSSRDSLYKGKRSLMDMCQSSSATTTTTSLSTPKRKKSLRSSRSGNKTTRSGNDNTNKMIESRDIMTPNTRKLVKLSHKKSSKILNDSIHTHVVLEPVCVRIVDTPQFQRLVSCC